MTRNKWYMPKKRNEFPKSARRSFERWLRMVDMREQDEEDKKVFLDMIWGELDILNNLGGEANA